MIKLSFFKIIVPTVLFFNLLQAISNKDLPHMGHEANSLLRKNTITCLYHQGIFSINDYGWYITKKWNTPLKQIVIEGKPFNVKKHYDHDIFDFTIFKVETNNKHQIDSSLFLKYLANNQDLKDNKHWVTSCAIINSSISTTQIDVLHQDFVLPLYGISKIKEKANGYITLELEKYANIGYENLWPAARKKYLNFLVEHKKDIKELLKKFNPENNRKSNTRKVFNEDKKKLLETMELVEKDYKKLLTISDYGGEIYYKEHKYVMEIIDKYLNNNYFGIPDKEDCGGFILVPSEKYELVNSKAETKYKVVGITHMNKDDDFKKGEKSTAIDLTTDEVRNWILINIEFEWIFKSDESEDILEKLDFMPLTTYNETNKKPRIQ